MHAHKHSEDSPSLGERILVEKSQDSVQVTKQRMQRRSATSADGGQSQDTPDGHADGQQRVLFSDDAVEVGSAPKKGRGSIGKRLSAALGFKKKSPLASGSWTAAGSGPVLGSSPSSPRVKFAEQRPEVIGQGGSDAACESPAAPQP